MSKLAFATIALVTLNVAFAVPLHKPLPPTPPTSNIDFFANQTSPPCTTRDDIMSIKNGIIDGRYRWQAFNVHPDRGYDQNELNAINNAMYNLMQVIPCVSFGIWPPDSNPSGDFIHIIKGTGNGCNSFIGKLGGRQDMNLQSPGCMSIGTIMHEMIHALGFHHEQCRPDRDDWVNIHWENIQGGMSYNFDKLPSDQWSTFGVPYNTRSIMHYDNYAFSSNGQMTMSAKNGGALGSEGVLQQTDIQRLKNMYNC